MRFLVLVAAATLLCASGASARRDVQQVCPFIDQTTPPSQEAPVPPLDLYNNLLAQLSIPDVIRDIIFQLTNNQACWPADRFNDSAIGQSYGGLFVRQAWHCAGSWRRSDGAGGCAGGHMRFPPESSWMDNTNLDKARSILYPIKSRYGEALSWGDLIILAGTASILHMGRPVTEVCVGRIDEPDGTKALPLGPSDVAPPCPIQGDCQEPLGAAVVGLIYVNPEGYMGVPNREHSAVQIRNVFARMEMNDTETVALIGGGHAFGKSHGACPNGAGPSPLEQPENPWPGLCGSGRGEDAFTSGIEGAWTNDPFKWDNEYFQLLAQYGNDYELERGPGGAYQWALPDSDDGLMMMTTDLALWEDEAYRRIVQEFATNQASLDVAFANAWEKLVTRGGEFAAAKHCWTPDDRFKAHVLN